MEFDFSSATVELVALAVGRGVYLDESLRRFATVFPACGSSNSAIELSPAELEELTPSSTWVNV